MPDIQTHSSWLSAAAGALASGSVLAALGLNGSVLVVAGIGSLFGVMALEPTSFKRAFFTASLGTVSTGFALSWAIVDYPPIKVLGIAFFIAGIGVYKQKWVEEKFMELANTAIDAIKSLIARKGEK